MYAPVLLAGVFFIYKHLTFIILRLNLPIAQKKEDINMRNSSLTFDMQPKKLTRDKVMVDYIYTNNVCSINSVSNLPNDYDICGEYCITKKPSIDNNTNIIAAFEKNDMIDFLLRVDLHAKNGKACIGIEKPIKPVHVTTLHGDIFLNQIGTAHVRNLDVTTDFACKIKKNLQAGYQEYKRLSDANKVKIGKIKILHKEH